MTAAVAAGGMVLAGTGVVVMLLQSRRQTPARIIVVGGLMLTVIGLIQMAYSAEGKQRGRRRSASRRPECDCLGRARPV